MPILALFRSERFLYSLVGIILACFVWFYFNPPASWRYDYAGRDTAGVTVPKLEIDSQNRSNFFMTEKTELPWGGFVVVRRAVVQDQEIIGVSDYLSAGVHPNVIIVPVRPVGVGESLEAQLVKDNGDGMYDDRDQEMPVIQQFIITNQDFDQDLINASSSVGL